MTQPARRQPFALSVLLGAILLSGQAMAAVTDQEILQDPKNPGQIVTNARQTLSAYANMEELIRIGAYRAGADPAVDRAIALNPQLEAFLGQDKDEATSLDESFERLAQILMSEAA